MRNNVNRVVNCETANLQKTVNAAVQQIRDITIIQQSGKYGFLTPKLQEAAELRLKIQKQHWAKWRLYQESRSPDCLIVIKNCNTSKRNRR